jgi:beta-hydroxylase
MTLNQAPVTSAAAAAKPTPRALERARWLAHQYALDLILSEYRRISQQSLPSYQDIEQVNTQINTDDQWKTYFLHYYGYRLAKAERECPATVAALHKVPGLQFAMLSILAPGKHIPAHNGPYAGVLRYHLGVDVPEGCVLRIDEERRSWQNGKSLVFDDSFEHEVWNHSEQPRCVLFVDFERPLPWPLCRLNRWLLAQSASTQIAKDSAKNLRVWEQASQT